MKTPEELLARVMNTLAQTFKNELILKGGMLLRLLNSPRGTQDLDYAWVRTKKRTLFAEEIKKTLGQMEGIQVTNVHANSRGIFIRVLDQPSGQEIKIEINVIKSLNLPYQPMTTAALSHKFSLQPQVISTMNLSESFAHKLAASLERDLVRDLYDLMQLEPLTSIDEKTFKERLSGLEIKRAKPQSISLQDAAGLLKKRSDELTYKRLEEELADTIPPEQLAGLDIIIRASLSRIIRKIEKMEATQEAG